MAPDGVHLGTGDGTFEAPSARARTRSTPAEDPPRSPSAISTAITTSTWPSPMPTPTAFRSSLGNGDGTFQPATTIGLPAGKRARRDRGGRLRQRPHRPGGRRRRHERRHHSPGNDGDGTFRSLQPIAVGQGPVAIAEGDFENDGQIDLAVADNVSGDVTVLSNQGEGTFPTAGVPPLPAASSSDVHRGRRLRHRQVDLAVTDSNQNVVDILEATATARSHSPSSLAVGANPLSIVAGDFGNGHIDLASPTPTPTTSRCSWATATGRFRPRSTRMADGVNGADWIDRRPGDFDGNGRLDLATGNAGTNDIAVLLGKGNGTFESWPPTRSGTCTAAVATGDFTGNGNLGLAVLNQGSDSVTILPGNGDGTFQQSLTVALPPGSGAVVDRGGRLQW